MRVCTSRVKGVLAAERPDGGHSEAGGAGAVAGLGRAEDGDGAGQVLQEGAVCQRFVYVAVVFLFGGCGLKMRGQVLYYKKKVFILLISMFFLFVCVFLPEEEEAKVRRQRLIRVTVFETGRRLLRLAMVVVWASLPCFRDRGPMLVGAVLLLAASWRRLERGPVGAWPVACGAYDGVAALPVYTVSTRGVDKPTFHPASVLVRVPGVVRLSSAVMCGSHRARGVCCSRARSR